MAEIIFALDFDDLNQAVEWVQQLKQEIKFFKIGLQLFTRYGPEAVKTVREQGVDVFLDLKLHDIPNTCAMAVKAAADLGCYSITIHVQAGAEALSRAKMNQDNGHPHLWGVTVLSSMENGDSMAMARLANSQQIEGLIVSGRDIANVRKEFPGMEVVVPGIRPADYNKKDDQKRVLTPEEAVKMGADFLVIGRPIKEAENPLKTVQAIKKSC